MRRNLASLLLLAVALPFGASADDLEVSARLGWASAAQPVLHVLIMNRGKELRNLGVIAPEKTTCNGKRVGADPDHYRPFLDITNWHDSSTNGVVQPGKWLHRSFPLSKDAPLEPPCETTYTISDIDERSVVKTGSLSIPRDRPKRQVADFDQPRVSADLLVEQDRDYPGLLIARVLVRNESQRGLTLYEDEREVRCENATQADWPVLGGVLQGEDAGPYWVEPGGWTVFVDVLTLKDPDAAPSCSAEFRISALHESGERREVARVAGSLEARGYLERPWRHRR